MTYCQPNVFLCGGDIATLRAERRVVYVADLDATSDVTVPVDGGLVRFEATSSTIVDRVRELRVFEFAWWTTMPSDRPHVGAASVAPDLCARPRGSLPTARGRPDA